MTQVRSLAERLWNSRAHISKLLQPRERARGPTSLSHSQATPLTGFCPTPRSATATKTRSALLHRMQRKIRQLRPLPPIEAPITSATGFSHPQQNFNISKTRALSWAGFSRIGTNLHRDVAQDASTESTSELAFLTRLASSPIATMCVQFAPSTSPKPQRRLASWEQTSTVKPVTTCQEGRCRYLPTARSSQSARTASVHSEDAFGSMSIQVALGPR